MSLLVLSHADIHAALDPAECERAMAEVLAAHARGEAANPLRSMWAPAGAPGFMGLMPAHAPGTFALKALCLMPGNPARGLDTHQGVVMLSDGETGRPAAILDASAVTAIRTAAVTAAATRALARPDARVLAILGAGVQARAHLTALAGVREWEEVRVYAPTAAHAQALADTAAGIRATGSAREAVEGADVVVTATSAREPVLERGWLRDGAHVNAVGVSIPGPGELDVQTVATAAYFCDSRESVRAEAGEFRLALEQGAISGEDHIRAELGEVLAGTAPGRTGPDELTVFRSLGIGVEDLAAAQLAVQTARRRGLGTDVEL
ncbi:MAG TPA: ornithine cyclodeaminase family protein [Solirubrobacteraceae bacterium]|nr:ornithine cyclodeaminase family protein [Solirubrobacteraceae bacterium]